MVSCQRRRPLSRSCNCNCPSHLSNQWSILSVSISGHINPPVDMPSPWTAAIAEEDEDEQQQPTEHRHSDGQRTESVEVESEEHLIQIKISKGGLWYPRWKVKICTIHSTVVVQLIPVRCLLELPIHGTNEWMARELFAWPTKDCYLTTTVDRLHWVN